MSSVDYNSALSPLSWLFGKWQSVEAVVCYPTMETFNYDEIVEFQPTMQPILDYKSETWHSIKKTKMHCESGFIRIDPESKKVALLVSHNFGTVEISEGNADNQSLLLESREISRPSFIKYVAKKVVRKWELKGQELLSSVYLETNNQPLQIHLQCVYKRKD